jgi:MFS family permease
MLAATTTQTEYKALKNPALQAWIVCVSAALFFFYEFIQMGMFDSIAPALMNDFSINATQLGNLSATYFYADVIFLLIAGVILDRFSVRKVILSAMLLCVAATFVFALSTSLTLAIITHFAAGIGNAFCFLSCIKLSSRWFSSRHLALVIGVIVTIAMAGGVFAQTPLTLLTQTFGWRHAVLLDGVLGIIILFIIWYFVYDNANSPDDTTAKSSITSKMTLSQSLRFALSNKQNWLAGIYTCLLNLPIFLLGELWGEMYLTQVHHIARTQASYITSMVFIGTIIGAPVVGWFSDKIGRRLLPMILGAILALASMLILMYTTNLSFAALLLLFLAIGFFTSTQIISYPAITESNPKILTGTATGLASVLIMGGGAVFEPLFGWLMDLHATHAGNAAAIYSATDYMRGMLIMPIAFVIGLIAVLLMKETRCQPYRN